MTDPTFGLYDRLKWWYSGEVAEVVCDDHDGWQDAIGMPVFALLVASTMSISSFTALQSSSTVLQVAGAVTLIIGVFTIAYSTVLVGAAIVYATETTELPLEGEKAINKGKS